MLNDEPRRACGVSNNKPMRAAGETIMATYPLSVSRNRARVDELHPRIYGAIIGLTLWLVLSIWLLFSRSSYEGLTLAVITLFFIVLVAIPLLLWLTWRHNTPEQSDDAAPLSEWIASSFQTSTGGISGREASI